MFERLALTLVLIAGACTPKVGDACELSHDCGSKLQCVAKVCMAFKEVGERCSTSVRCEKGLWCVAEHCTPPAAEGEPCTTSYRDYHPCTRELYCFEGSCTTAEKRTAIIEERDRVAALETERRMLEESGALRDVAEATPKTDQAPRVGSVRVVEVTGKGFVFAACRESERLIGGSCSGGTSRPSEFTATDTIGARWTCESSGYKMTAIALCALVEPLAEGAPSPVTPTQ